MKSQKGSITVIALIMLLFLVVLGGAWAIMMTQEKTNALTDEKQQQAWYAAEAGFKRAAVLLTQTSANWNKDFSWTTTNATNFNSNDRDKLIKIDLKTLEAVTNTKDVKDQPWYAVHIQADGTDIGDSYSRPTAATTFTVTSIGDYMGERKIIKRTVKFTASGDGGSTTKVSLPGVIQTAGNITFDNATSSIEGSLYGATITDKTGAKFTGGHYDTSDSTYKGTFLTHLTDSLFDIKKYTITEDLVPTDQGDGYKLLAGKTYSMDLKTAANYWQKITAQEGSTLILYNSTGNNKTGTLLVNSLVAPTSGKPLTILSLLTSEVIFKGNYSGRIRVISNGSIDINNSSNWAGNTTSSKTNVSVHPNNAYMFLSNGWINQDAPLNVAYLSSDYDGTGSYDAKKYTYNGYSVYLNKTFQGVVYTPGDVAVKTPITYDSSIYNDPDFVLPDGIVEHS